MHDRVIEQLAAIGTPCRFAVRQSGPPDDLRLQVRGVGHVPLPVSKTRARRLRSVARPARYGLREQTLLDPRVRDTWEVPRSRVRVDQRRWNRTLLPQLERIAADLGVPQGCRLKAQLHSMLLYEPGQFFAAHQDSETSDDMVGSLVVLLPSEAKGGALVVEHNGEKVTYQGSATRLTFLAFYADCRHEVQPVREGYRVALTYNLVRTAAGDRSEPELEPGRVDALSEAVDAYFSTPRGLSRDVARPSPRPSRPALLYPPGACANGGRATASAARSPALTPCVIPRPFSIESAHDHRRAASPRPSSAARRK